MKDLRKISKRYAQALMAAVQDSSADTITQAEASLVILQVVAEAFKNNPEVATLFSNPAIPKKEKEQFLVNFVKENFKADELTLNFFKVLSDNSRVLAIKEIAKEFEALLAGFKKALILEVASAYELTTSEKQALVEKLQSGIKNELTVNWHVDSKLLGGLVVSVGDKVFDGSLQSSLSKAKEALLA